MEVAIKKLQIVAAENDDNEDSNDIIVKRFIYEASKQKIYKITIAIISFGSSFLSKLLEIWIFCLKIFQISEFCKIF